MVALLRTDADGVTVAGSNGGTAATPPAPMLRRLSAHLLHRRRRVLLVRTADRDRERSRLTKNGRGRDADAVARRRDAAVRVKWAQIHKKRRRVFLLPHCPHGYRTLWSKADLRRKKLFANAKSNKREILSVASGI